MTMRAGGGLGTGAEWSAALENALGGALAPLDGEAPELLLLFASAAYEVDDADLIGAAAASAEQQNWSAAALPQ